MFKRVFLGGAALVSACAMAVGVVLRDMIGLAAVGLIAYGAWLIFPPAGFIAGGGLLLVGSLIASRE